MTWFIVIVVAFMAAALVVYKTGWKDGILKLAFATFIAISHVLVGNYFGRKGTAIYAVVFLSIVVLVFVYIYVTKRKRPKLKRRKRR